MSGLQPGGRCAVRPEIRRREQSMPTVFVNGRKRQYDKGTTFEKIVSEFQPEYNNTIALVYFNGKMRELNKRLDKDGVISLITTKDAAGYSAYVRSATLMLVKAVHDLTAKDPEGPLHVKVEFTLGSAYFCTLHHNDAIPEEDDGFEGSDDDADASTDAPEDSFTDAGDDTGDGDVEYEADDENEVMLDPDFVTRIGESMRVLAERNLPISKKTYPIDDALRLFRRQDMEDKVRLFHFRRSSTVNVYALDGYYDYFYGYMLPSTGYVRQFEVEPYREGLLLRLPERERPGVVAPFHEEKNLYEQLMLSTEWGELVDIATVGDLDEQICGGHISDMILVQEALQERRIGEIAEEIYDREGARVILVAGPSSSGKTTFAHRLAIQLRSFGLRPTILSMDNWFVPRERTPIDDDGNYNFEVLEALDLELFNENMVDLLNGEEVELPSFDFKNGKRLYKNGTTVLGPDDILIIEGIHGLNPKTSESIPDDSKFKIYTSALTSLNIDEHNRIPSSDTRLLRRIVRDARTRGYSAKETIAQWKKVREGEEKYIFPFQDNVDAVFNSVLIYEQAVLKQFAEPLLFSVPQDSPEYYEAKRLLKFLEYFVGVDTAVIPANSICREFVGGGCFPV